VTGRPLLSATPTLSRTIEESTVIGSSTCAETVALKKSSKIKNKK
jgi:hypothetical protein